MNLKYTFLIISLLLIALSGCEINKLRDAQELYNNERYAAAIQAIDEYLPNSENGAIRTRAEMLRSQSYLNLAELAIDRQNWTLAKNFLKLANSAEADVQLAKIYKMLANRALEAGDIATESQFINAIIREIPRSELIPEMLFRRIKIHLDVHADRDAAWRDYMNLYDSYPNNSYELQARSMVQKIIPMRTDLALALMQQEYFNDALAVLFELSRYPVINFEELNILISDTYQAQAEAYIVDQDFMSADHHFRIAVQYYPPKRELINQRLIDIASMFIEKGNSLLEAREFDAALRHYQKTFDILPNYKQAVQAIERLNTIRANIQRAAILFIEAERHETANRFAMALPLYVEAASLDDKPEYQSKVRQMQNLIEATKNPNAFVQRIINEYRGGLLNRKINELKRELSTRYRADEINDSGWKILLSTGQYKYEARYDILTPNETYFYIWQVNLRDRSVVPLNKISENLIQ